MSAAVQMQPAPGPVEITLSMSILDQAERVPDAAWLYRRWAQEEGRSPDLEGYAAELMQKIVARRYCLIVAYDGEQPIGMAGSHIEYDPARAALTCFGEKLYILPEYRHAGVFQMIHAAGEVLALVSGSSEQVISCRQGSTLQRHYESWGFQATDVVMRRSRDAVR
jgi:hypothetical protein